MTPSDQASDQACCRESDNAAAEPAGALGALGALAPDADALAPDYFRRRLLKRLGTVSMGLALARGLSPRMARAEEPPASDVFVFIFLRGGLDGLNAVVPYGDPDYTPGNRPTVGVFDSVPLGDGFFGAHPALSALVGPGRAWDPTTATGDLALLHAVGSPADSRSHFDAQDVIDRGVGSTGSTTDDGWLARHLLARSGQGNTLRAVAVSSNTPVSLIARGLHPVVLHTLADVALSSANPAVVEPLMRRMYEGFGHSMVGASATALDAVASVRGLGTYTPALGVTYGSDPLANGMKSLAQLIKAGPTMGLEVASVDVGPFDLHRGMGTSTAGALHDRLSELGNALAAFRADLHDVEVATARRYWDRVTVAVISEFGRRFKENGSGGTDHGHGGVMMVLGGGISAKAPTGSNVWLRDGWPGLSNAPDRPAGTGLVSGDLQIRMDYRDVLWEVATRRLGALEANRQTVFPGFSPSPALGFAQAR